LVIDKVGVKHHSNQSINWYFDLQE